MSSQDPQFHSVSLETLEIGAMLECPVYEDRGNHDVLVVSGGATITAELLQKLRTRGISSIRVAGSDLEQMGVSLDDIPNLERDGLPGDLSADSHLHDVKQHGAVTYDAETVEAFEENYNESLDQVGDFFDVLSGGGEATDSEMVENVSGENINKLTEDLDLFISLGLGDKQDKYPYRHSLQCMMLAASVGTTMGLTKSQLTDLGTGCLLHDVGMVMIDRRVWDARKKLSEMDRLEISKHPTLAFDRVNKIPQIPNGARMVVFQMHERMDGSGYPRKRRAAQIHPLSKIAMVADIFVALVSARPQRPGLMPYQAMEHIIKQTKEGLLDAQVVRELLKTVSLFPITSYVVMSDGRIGKVIRSTGETYTRPIVDLWHPDATNADPQTVDLTTEPDLEVTRPLTRFEADQLGLVKITNE